MTTPDEREAQRRHLDKLHRLIEAEQWSVESRRDGDWCEFIAHSREDTRAQLVIRVKVDEGREGILAARAILAAARERERWVC